MKIKKLCLSPHLKSHSPHVANGDNVGQRWFKWIYEDLPVKFPAGVAHLATGLTHVHRDTFTLKRKKLNN